MFFCVGTYLALDLHFLVEAYINHSATPGGPLAYLNNPGSNVSVTVSTAIFAFLTLLGDAFMAYRVFVVWNGMIIALVPSGLLVIGDAVTTGLVGHALLHSGGPTTYSKVIYVPGARSPLIAYFLMTILTNLGTTWHIAPWLLPLFTALLLGRLYWHDRRTRRHLPQDMYSTAAWRVMKSIIQSQAVYTIGVIFNLVTFLAKSNLVFITNAILSPLIGISFTLIITRIGLSEVLGNTSHAQSMVSRPMEFNNSGHVSSHDNTVNVFISQSDDHSEDVAVGRTKSLAAMT
ncbi:uncharacterized protein TRAVEDRAFT_53241 [Trametes versicolor FP-101664 SS1]|uniref:uncharacterized protein n=1 Tax=Trametes versicolor (strain FP-101664) TaxID=717944 RepID=UPI00046230E6|nr:uncharacterized protein TRAVEDRAFT_53241 [Trametes versicolor FP-101664 SS1]EIW52802.1 hypothetical protein TRAVEDRAFT_53241 [Trametes versicolor FP-101664 SS1]